MVLTRKISCGVVLSSKIERIQNYALRFIFHRPPCTSSAPLREIIGWTTLKTRRRHIALLCQVHRCLRKEAPNCLTCKFLTNSYLNYSTTRGAKKIHLNRPNTNFYRSTFEYTGAQAYNSLPREIRDIISVHTFKRALNPLMLAELALYMPLFIFSLFNISVPCFCLYSRTCMKTYMYCRYSISASTKYNLIYLSKNEKNGTLATAHF